MTSDLKNNRKNDRVTLSSISPNSLTMNVSMKNSVIAEKSNQSARLTLQYFSILRHFHICFLIEGSNAIAHAHSRHNIKMGKEEATGPSS
jgi:hypothetical protein